jgi:hypothetical protein
MAKNKMDKAEKEVSGNIVKKDMSPGIKAEERKCTMMDQFAAQTSGPYKVDKTDCASQGLSGLQGTKEYNKEEGKNRYEQKENLETPKMKADHDRYKRGAD